MNTYTVRISTDTQRSALHAPACQMVANRKAGRFMFVDVQGETPETARAQHDEDEQVKERGLPNTTICRCCYE